MEQFEKFGKQLFSKEEMKRRLPRPVYLKWRSALYNEAAIDRETADAIAHAMKTWALEKGATHYSHLFQPMNGLTAEKHDAFMDKDKDNQPLIRFSGKSLIKGETDGSSFPNGGLRATFEARGYTYWDSTSYAFVRGHVLYIPSIFISYNGDKLDMKAPLIEAIDSLSHHATKLLHRLGMRDVKSVNAMVGLEQEYFLIDEKYYAMRPDLRFTKRTLIGAKAPKGQEFEDHYFGAIHPRVLSFMEEVNLELWQLGIYANVEHNEVAYGQYEICTLFENAVVAIDQNLLLMDILQTVARKHGFVCLLHEKPFSQINGSGKHNNFSLQTNTGFNLFQPKETTQDNVVFVLLVSLFIKAIDKYASLIRMATSDAGNDHRLGGAEAPPAIVSVFLGDVITDLFEQISQSTSFELADMSRLYSPLSRLLEMPYDTTDRNRTSPISFTGNKFEIRMLGSSKSASMLNITLISMMAYEIQELLEKLDESIPLSQEDALIICQNIIREHGRTIFKGDGYTEAWKNEATKRGLSNLSSYCDSIDALVEPTVVKMFEAIGVFKERELSARKEILYHQFNLTIMTEARTLLSMVNQDIIPSLMKYIREVTRTDIALEKKSKAIQRRQQQLNMLLDQLDEYSIVLEQFILESELIENEKAKSKFLNEKVRHQMELVREVCDKIEQIISRTYYPYPTYSEMLFID